MIAPLVLAAAAALPGSPAGFSAQPPRQPSAAELELALGRLATVGSVLYVAAHPDDENTRLLAWLVRDRGLSATYLSLTRGDGGQNLIGSEQGPLLGLIRTQELLAARRVDGAEQLFTRARDFGYSKRADETLAIWSRDEVLADVVLAIRRTRPDVIVTRFPPTGGDTHGHHTASAILAVEAFERAADPAYHPEQVAAFGAWRATRVVWNESLFGGAKPDDYLAKFVKLDVGGYSALLGQSWGEVAATSRTNHKSQGFGAAPRRGPALEYFQVLAGEPMKNSILDGVDAAWTRLPNSERVRAALARAREGFRAASPAASIPSLVALATEIDRLPASPLRDRKRREVDDLIVGCAGLYAEVVADSPSVVAGGTAKLTLTAINRSPAKVIVRALRVGGEEQTIGRPLVEHAPLELAHALTVPPDTRLTQPAWLDEPPGPGQGMYAVADAALIGLPEEPPPLVAAIDLTVGDRAITIERAVAFKWTDPVHGERFRRMEVLPRLAIDPAAPMLPFPDERARPLRVTVRGFAPSTGEVSLELGGGFHAEPTRAPFHVEAGGQSELVFQVKPPIGQRAATSRAEVVATVDGVRYTRGLLRIDHPHIPIQTVRPTATVVLSRFDLHERSLEKRHVRIGYIAGAGDEVAAALRLVGYEVTALGDEELRAGDLSRFDAIVTGVRAFNVNPRLEALHDRLMRFVAGGGALVVQYNTNNRLSKVPQAIGPAPFRITQARVTDEKAEVTMDDHPILRAPNRITPADFEGWVQERGLYFASDWGAGCDAPLAMHNPGEPPSRGALLVCRHGKGAFVYTGLAFFRQLPAGVPGAFRLFANLIAHGQ